MNVNHLSMMLIIRYLFIQVGMKPEMVDAMLKRNPEAGKRRKKADPPMGKVNSTPVFSREIFKYS